jgi:Aldehyde dehydrogenase family
VQIVYLDQNKWIDLSRAVKHPADYPELRTVLEALVEEATAGRIVVPLTQTNIYETHKINDPERRHDLAYVQATLSQGRVFRGRHKRLETEVTAVLRGAYGLVGALWINEATRFRLDNYPFGGTKRSGVGREGIRYAIEEFSQIKFTGITI